MKHAVVLMCAGLIAGCSSPAPPGSSAARSSAGGREASLRAPVYGGVKAWNPIPPKYHVQNEGGSDGAGLCVIASVLENGQFQNLPGMRTQGDDGHAGHGSLIWKTAKSRPGGYYPEKLASLVRQTNPRDEWASYEGTSLEVLEKAARAGPVGATMGTGELYGWAPISHMISLLHFDRSRNVAIIQDNNEPGVYRGMAATEFARRWVMPAGYGWAWWWIVSPLRGIGGALLFLGACVIGALIVYSTVRDKR